MEKINVSPMSANDYIAFLKTEIGEKRAERATTENMNVPTRGTFAKIVSIETNISGKTVKYPTLLVINENGEHVGNVSVGSILQSKATEKTYQVKKESSIYKGKFGVVSEPINKLNGSESVAIPSLIGKRFEIERKEFMVPKLSFDDAGNCLHLKDSESEALEQIEKKVCSVLTLI